MIIKAQIASHRRYRARRVYYDDLGNRSSKAAFQSACLVVCKHILWLPEALLVRSTNCEANWPMSRTFEPAMVGDTICHQALYRHWILHQQWSLLLLGSLCERFLVCMCTNNYTQLHPFRRNDHHLSSIPSPYIPAAEAEIRYVETEGFLGWGFGKWETHAHWDTARRVQDKSWWSW